MPPFDFPSVEQLLDEYIRQNQGRSLMQSPPAETPSGTDAANEATVAGLQQKKQELEQAQQMTQAQQQAQQMAQAQQQAFIDPVARQYYIPKLLGAKQLYASTADPNVQQQASALADTWRQEASNAGFDLSGFGADVSLEDAYRNLATNDARAAVDLTQGKFALRPEDYNQRQFKELMGKGYSVGQAQRIAAMRTQEYQADRYQYLNNMLNGYGFDDKVMTPYGRQVLGELFQQAPELANLYASTSASQKDEYNKENQMAQQILSHENGLENMLYQAMYNQRAAEQQATLSRLGAKEQGQIARDNATHAAELSQQNWLEQQEYSRRAALEDLRANTIETYNLTKELLGEEKAEAVLFGLSKLTGVKGVGGKADTSTGSMSDDKLATHLIDAYKAINQRIKDLDEKTLDKDDPQYLEQKSQLEASAQDFLKRIQQVTTVYGEVPKFSGDESADLVVAGLIRDYFSNAGYSEAQIKTIIYKQCLEETKNKKHAEKISGTGMH